jgi:anti-anti-sigma factor
MSMVPVRRELEPDLARERSGVEFRHDDPGFAATVVLCGDHDMATSEAVRVALAAFYGRILVDLTRCSFIDSTAMGLLVQKQRELVSDGGSLELLVSADPLSDQPIERGNHRTARAAAHRRFREVA